MSPFLSVVEISSTSPVSWVFSLFLLYSLLNEVHPLGDSWEWVQQMWIFQDITWPPLISLLSYGIPCWRSFSSKRWRDGFFFVSDLVLLFRNLIALLLLVLWMTMFLSLSLPNTLLNFIMILHLWTNIVSSAKCVFLTGKKSHLLFLGNSVGLLI